MKVEEYNGQLTARGCTFANLIIDNTFVAKYSRTKSGQLLFHMLTR